MVIFLMILMVAVGALVPVQAGINAVFGRQAGHPLLAGLINFTVGWLAMVTLTLAFRVPWPTAERLAQLPWWAWLGGLCGASLVMSAIIAAPRLGATLLIAALLTGQLGSSVLLDHFGLLGYLARPASFGRVIGVALLVCGVVLIHRN